MYILYVLALCSIGWALFTKIQQHKIVEFVILTLASVCVIINALLVFRMIQGELTVGWHILQMGLGSAIVPLVYTYFAYQIGVNSVKKAIPVMLSVLWLLTFVPEIIIYNPFEPFILPADGLKPFAFYVLSHGVKKVAIYTGDLVVILQCIVVLLRVLLFILKLRSQQLQLSSKIYAVGASWIIAGLLSIVFSCMSYSELRSEGGMYFYYGSYCLALIVFNVFIAKGFDMSPVESDQGEVIENLEVYVHHKYSEMAQKVRVMMEDECLYTDPQITAERIIGILHTNHTYFSEMMSVEWGMSFSEYVNNLRLLRIKELLADKSLTILSIATQCGFSDAGYMSKKFRQKFGMTPTEWRKQH